MVAPPEGPMVVLLLIFGSLVHVPGLVGAVTRDASGSDTGVIPVVIVVGFVAETVQFPRLTAEPATVIEPAGITGGLFPLQPLAFIELVPPASSITPQPGTERVPEPLAAMPVPDAPGGEGLVPSVTTQSLPGTFWATALALMVLERKPKSPMKTV